MPQDDWKPTWEFSDEDYIYLAEMEAERNRITDAINDRHELVRMRAEAAFWKRKYDELIRQSIQSGEETMFGVLKAVMSLTDKNAEVLHVAK